MPRDTTQLLEAPICPEIEVLDRMRDLMATPEQWCQGVENTGNAYCLIGAMVAAAPAFADYQPVCNAMHKELKSFWALHAWNDAPERTHADILDLLTRTRRRFE